MKNDSKSWSMGLYWIPFVVGLATACTYLYFLAARGQEFDIGLVIILSAGVVIGLLAVTQAIFAAADARALAAARRNADELERRLAEARDHSRQLSAHFEVLSAMREVTHILSDAVDLDQIAERVFDVLQPLLEASEIVLFIQTDQGDLEPRVVRRGRETLFPDEFDGTGLDLDQANEALERQTLVKTVEGETSRFSVPLIADQKPVGVMRFDIPLDGSPDEKAARLDEFEAVLANIAKHLALVVKTPNLHDRATIDGLTGLFTRRHFDIRIADMFRLGRRYATPFSLLLIDLDHFKEVNDQYGHRAGDVVLAETALLVTNGIRDCDSAFRYGGEEFAVLLPETTAKEAWNIAERLRKNIKENEVAADGHTVSVTICTGIAEYSPELANHGELVARADQALYNAKQSGRDRTVLAGAAARGSAS